MKILIGLIALSFIVFFHELGHFIFAKLFGVKVLSFSIGMGPVLLHKTIKGTDYRISLLPFGGYCGMEGEKDFQKAIEEKLESLPKNPESLYGVHPVKRACIAFAGPFFNFILSFIAYIIISMVGYQYYTLSNRIIIPDDSIQSPAREAGLITGDRIIKINNKETKTFTDLYEEIALRPKEELTLLVDRDGQLLTFYVTTLINKDQGNGILGILGDSSTYEKVETPTFSFFPAIKHGFIENLKMIKRTLKSLGILFKGVDVTKAVSGPARVTSMLGETVSQGFKVDFRAGLCSTLELLALISISLGIMNLLPIPVLDGGLILFAVIALILRKEVPPKIQYKIQFIGIFIIGILFIIGTTGDIRYFISKWVTK